MDRQYAQAEFLLWEVLRKSPRAPQTTYLLGLCLLMRGRIGEARRAIDRAYRLRPRLPDSIPERIADVEVFDTLKRAAAEYPDWEWPRYQLLRERFRAVDASVANAIDHLVSSSAGARFVQIGANDGVGDPLVGSIAKHKLEGLFVEPQPIPFAELKALYADRSGLEFERCAVADDEGPVELVATSGQTTLGTLVPERNLMKDKSDGDRESITVPGLHFDTVMAKHGVEKFQVLQMDTEGYDYRVLRQVDLDKYGVDVVNMEFYLLPLSERIATFELLNRKGFAYFFSKMDLLALRVGRFAGRFCISDFLGEGPPTTG